jgi:hypothetical protein
MDKKKTEEWKGRPRKYQFFPVHFTESGLIHLQGTALGDDEVYSRGAAARLRDCQHTLFTCIQKERELARPRSPRVAADDSAPYDEAMHRGRSHAKQRLSVLASWKAADGLASRFR